MEQHLPAGIGDRLGQKAAGRFFRDDVQIFHNAAERLEQLLVRAQAEGFEQQSSGQLAAAVDVDRQRIAGHDELHPGAALGNDLRRIVLRARGAWLGLEINAGAAGQLVDDDALGTVDDEGAARSHDGKIAEVDLLLAHFLRTVVVQAHFGPDRTVPRAVAAFCLLLRHGRFVDLVAQKLKTKTAVEIADRGNLVEKLLKAYGLAIPRRCVFLEKTAVGLALDFHHVGKRNHIVSAAENQTLTPLAHRNKLSHAVLNLHTFRIKVSLERKFRHEFLHFQRSVNLSG